MKYIDLSHLIENNMPVYPGDKEIKINKDKEFNVDGYNAFSMECSMHLGTHIDCPMHMANDERYISNYPIDKFLGCAVLIDARGQKEIDLKEEYFKSIKENTIVLIYTGFDEKYGSAEYYENHPVITIKLAEFLVRKKIKMIGIDMPSPDRPPYNVHKLFLDNEILILENLTNLNRLLYVEEFEVYAQPLKINSEASFVRAFACYKGY